MSNSKTDIAIQANQIAAKALMTLAKDFDGVVTGNNLKGNVAKSEARAIDAIRAAASFMKRSSDPEVVKAGENISQHCIIFASISRGERMANGIEHIKDAHQDAVMKVADKLSTVTGLSNRKLCSGCQVVAIAMYGANTGLNLAAMKFAVKKRKKQAIKYGVSGAALHMTGMFAEAVAQELYTREVANTVDGVTPTRH